MFSKRLKALRTQYKLTQEELGKRINVTKVSVSGYENGTRNPDSGTLQKIADIFEVSTDYLLGRENKQIQIPSNIYPTGQTIKIPVIGVIKAGANGLALKEHLGHESVDVDSVRGGTYFYLQVHGDSMIGDGIIEGDLALIREQNDVENGDVAAVIINGDEATLKRVYKADNSIVLQASNHNHPPRIFAGSECNKIHIVGKLREIKRKF